MKMGILMLEYKKRLAKILYQKSYKQGDFILTSGQKSDYYFDCRTSALDPEGAWLIGTLFYNMLLPFNIKGVAGLTMGADPLVTATSLISFHNQKPFYGLLVRKEEKKHGTKQYVEGLDNTKQGDAIAVLEDVVSTGGSLLKACQRIQDVNLKVVTVCTILDREQGGKELLNKAGFKLISLYTKQELISLASSN